MEIPRRIPAKWLVQHYVSKLAEGDPFTAHDIASAHNLASNSVITALNEMKCVDLPQYTHKPQRGHGVRNIYTKLKGKPLCEICPVVKSGRVGCIIKEDSIGKAYESRLRQRESLENDEI